MQPYSYNKCKLTYSSSRKEKMHSLLRTADRYWRQSSTSSCRTRSALPAEKKKSSWSNSWETSILSLISSTEGLRMDGKLKISILVVTKKVRQCVYSKLKTATASEDTFLFNGKQLRVGNWLKTTTPSSSIYQNNVTSPHNNTLTITYATTQTMDHVLREEMAQNLVYFHLLMKKTSVIQVQIKLLTRLASTKMETTCWLTRMVISQ
jgi:hypothetical protein